MIDPLKAKSESEKIPVVLIYNIDPQWAKEEQEEAVIVSEKLGWALREVGHHTEFVSIRDGNIRERLSGFAPEDWIVFNWCEAIPGDGHSEWKVARRLEEAGYVFTGAGSETLFLAQDKHRIKTMLKEQEVPTPKWILWPQGQLDAWDQYPAMIKPAQEHCSEGIEAESVVFSADEARERAEMLFRRYRQPLHGAAFIDGREFRVALWGNETLEMLPVAEMEFSHFQETRHRICSYEAKFVVGSEHYEKIATLLPAPLSAEETRVLEQICKKAYRATGCRDYARMDVRCRGGIFYVLDVNPNPDISFDASMPCAAEAAGMSYGEMASRIVHLAAKRHRRWREFA